MIEGTVEALQPDGLVRGWLRHTDDPAPAQIEIRLAGTSIAEAVAQSFRPDLLRSGHGHGHYGFLARLQAPLPAGPTRAELFLPRHRRFITVMLDVPDIVPTGPLRVEALLRPERAWTVRDLRANPACIDPGANLTALGTSRFVDMTFRFVLRRWPSPPEAQVFRAALQDGTLGAREFLAELLDSRERDDLGPRLVSPWDPLYPYGPT